MNKETKRKLRNISLLALVGLIGGTFAFQAFNQQAINDRLRDNEVEVGGRVHDYYNRDTENKDVFVENYGQEPIMARIRLSEFMEIQHRGSTEFEPVAPGTSREDVANWTTWLPSATDLDDRQGGSNHFDVYSDLTFGWERPDQPEEFAPWYLPTFNLIEDDYRTAAAGHARDWAEVGGDTDSAAATNGTTDGATHPGDGTDGYWSEGESYNNSAGDWFGSQVTREVAQNLEQQRPPVTLQQWAEELSNAEKIGDFWVIDHETGWAYWASQLQVGETTSYLLDAAEMKPAADAINGSYYYGIHVDSQLISPEQVFEDEPQEGHGGNLGYFLEGIRNNAVDDETGNPGAGLNSQPDEFNFSTMNPGRIFTMAGEQYRYLEDMGSGDHMIIRDSMIPYISFLNQETALTEWFDKLDDKVKSTVVRPVTDSFVTGSVADANIQFTGGTRFIPTNLDGEVAEDVTKVDENGTPRAFALSLADVAKLSGPGLAFPNLASRGTRQGDDNGWWLRTPGEHSGFAWHIVSRTRGAITGHLIGHGVVDSSAIDRGVRPALIIHQEP